MRGRNPIENSFASAISDRRYDSENWLLHLVIVDEDNPPGKRRKLIIEGYDKENNMTINKALYLDNRSRVGRSVVVDDFDHVYETHILSYEITKKQGIDLMNHALQDTSKLIIHVNPYKPGSMWKQSSELPYAGILNNESWIRTMIARIIPQELQEDKEVIRSLHR